MKTVGLLGPSGGVRQSLNGVLREMNQRIAAAEQRAYGAEKRLAAFLKQPEPLPLAPAPLGVQLFTDTADFEQDRTLLRAVDETYFKVELGAGYCNYNGAVTEVTTNNTVAMRMPNGASTAARRIVRGRDLWVKTRLKFEVWYTSPVGATANFALVAVYFAHDAGGAAAGAGISGAWTAPGPAVANTPMKTQFTLASPVFATPREVVRIAFGRTDPDDNVNDLDVYLVVATFEEVA